jgi:hypothetical protein
MPRHRNSFVDIVEFCRNVNFFGENLFVLAIVGRLERFGEVWSFFIDHLDYHPQSLWNDQNIRENDCSVYQTRKSINWLQGKRRGNLRRAAAFKKIMSAFGFVIFGKVSASWEESAGVVLTDLLLSIFITLTHHPHRRSLDFLTCEAISIC